MNGYAESPPSHSDPSKGVRDPKPGQTPLQEDVEMSSTCSGNESSENCRPGQGSKWDDTKELGMVVEAPEAHQGTNAFSLMMTKSEHNPSTSGCSSEQSGKADMHKELAKTLKELKVHLPADKKAKGRASTLATLKYALRSMKQVKANEEYYQLLMPSEHHLSGADVPSYTLEEIESMTSEHMVKNVDMFAVAVSLVTGKILYISDQVVSIFHCKRATFTNAKFVEFLAPHDVSVFHSSTTPYKLPAWGTCSGTDSFTRECMEEKSFFCRISVGKTHEDKVRYHPFRMTPYLVQVRDARDPESQLGCVLLAEKVHSGYEAPRIPPEKRVFTTTHTPNCLFQAVDGRVVPLLGYLPQDLEESPVLLQLHPSDRPLMLAIHRKILQSGGQPFDYSPIRFRARNGEYITLDTSWSSFINPWSRKVSFIIGRHKVRVGPLNEDVFAAPASVEEKALHPSIQELTEQIYQLLLQPVPHSGSSGYGSLGSNGSQEHLMSQTSSSDSNGREDAHQRRPEICKNGNKTKTKSHYSYKSGELKKKPARDLQSCLPAPTKVAPTTDKDDAGAGVPKATFPEELACKAQPACSYQQISCLDSVMRYLESCGEVTTLKRKYQFPALNASDKRKATGGSVSAFSCRSPAKADSHAEVSTHLTSLALPSKADSVLSLTSQCSYSSTLVHVGDKKPQPELEMIEDAASGAESLDGPAGPMLSCSLGPEKEPFKRLGLTKEVLAAHTQKEEQGFLFKFREIRKLSVLRSRYHYNLQERSQGQSSELTAPGLRNVSGVHSSWKKTGRNRKFKSKRAKPQDSSGSTASGGPVPTRAPLAGLNATAWSPSDTSQSSCPAVSFPAPMPAYPLPVFPAPGPLAAASNIPHTGFDSTGQPPPFAAPLTPVMAFVLPSYPFPAMAPGLPQAFFTSQTNIPGHPEMLSASQPAFPSRTPLLPQPCPCPRVERGQSTSRAATPATPSSTTGPTGRASPPLFQSRGSSPLQLNLLQMEETPEGGAAATGPVGTAAARSDTKPATARDHPSKAQPTLSGASEAQHSDALSTSSDLLDLLLHEDLCSATGSALLGSATSGSLGSGSLGCTVSRSGTGSSDTNHTSKYFGSIDSSENNRKGTRSADVGENERLIKYVLQDPIWLLMADTDPSVLLTYQMPARNLDAVLKEDREKLKALQDFQPQFTEAQKQELREVHPWMQMGSLPSAIDVQECVYCEDKGKGDLCVSHEEDAAALCTPEEPSLLSQDSREQT
ncbi:PREDICTED: period circadian protein homolog 2 [Chrysochloris asiatica]|uniref:Period circadian protein homolog 2 n=1 Tax=Chrysochloris asiatica TaxID=185453 RepID=A0A9B0TK84_CHRAS|nr:PREDICTED: period circadian protein homolog 2 [Chrysochloris asiatica]